jgi:hypothetical protein
MNKYGRSDSIAPRILNQGTTGVNTLPPLYLWGRWIRGCVGLRGGLGSPLRGVESRFFSRPAHSLSLYRLSCPREYVFMTFYCAVFSVPIYKSTRKILWRLSCVGTVIITTVATYDLHFGLSSPPQFHFIAFLRSLSFSLHCQHWINFFSHRTHSITSVSLHTAAIHRFWS